MSSVRLREVVILLVALAALAGCTSTTERVQLTVTTGFPGGVYHKLGNALAGEWAAQMGMPQPRVLASNGSPDNLLKLGSGEADVAFSAADVAIEGRDQYNLRALARIYDDYLHVVVLDNSPIRTLGQLAGTRVSIGARGSGVAVIAERVLTVAQLSGDIQYLGLPASIDALKNNQIDAFFWSGGLPTDDIDKLADEVPIRLLDMQEQMRSIRARFPNLGYSAATIPRSVYRLGNTSPVTTLIVPNLLLVTDRMPVDTAKALTNGIFEMQPKLAAVSTAASSIDLRSAIETLPIELHQGALEFYRDSKL